MSANCLGGSYKHETRILAWKYACYRNTKTKSQQHKRTGAIAGMGLVTNLWEFSERCSKVQQPTDLDWWFESVSLRGSVGAADAVVRMWQLSTDARTTD